MAALPLQDKISQSTQGERTFNIIKAQYGNGYQDRARDGLNPIKDNWTVNYENLGLTDYTTALAAFDGSFGVASFTWQPPGDTATKKWVVQKIARTIQSGNIYSISVTLEQVFDLS